MDEEDTLTVIDMDGNLFPYLSLVAFEGGGILRLIFLLLVSPLAGALYYVSESAYIRVLMFATFAGMRVSDIEWVARAVLPKFYASDMHLESRRVRGETCVVAGSPRIMVEPFLKEYLGADTVVGTEIESWRGRATGFVKRPAGLGDRRTNVKSSKERLIAPAKVQAKAIVFHDGRLVQKLSPLNGTLLVLWFPLGFVLACLRVGAICLLPMRLLYPVLRALGVRIHVKGHPPGEGHSGVLFVCSHRTLLDPIMLSIALARPVPAVTYSLSRFSELISPIKLVRLTRDRPSDASKMERLLEEGDLVICPEGTTCREPFLLRFSAMFAEMTDELVPVAMSCRMSMFHGTTARGWKGMDPYFFFMNPSPVYEVTFLDKLPKGLTCGGGGRSSVEVANYIQRMLATSLSFQCTTFTRKDKYRALVGKDDIMVAKPNNKLPHPQ